MPGVVESERRRGVSRGRYGTAKNSQNRDDRNRTAKTLREASKQDAESSIVE